jgi:menaquinone-dependent protoporphyrinogen oxidase
VIVVHVKILVTYATRYGGTRGIGERIAATLNASGVEAVVQSVNEATDLAAYDGFVLGSAVYIGSWMKDAINFARRHRDLLAAHPVWLFSSGPLGPTTDSQGHDVRKGAEPKQLEELQERLGARDHRVFFGVSDHTNFDLRDRLIYAVPSGKKLLLDGDFRDWTEVEAWTNEIARALKAVAA